MFERTGSREEVQTAELKKVKAENEHTVPADGGARCLGVRR